MFSARCWKLRLGQNSELSELGILGTEYERGESPKVFLLYNKEHYNMIANRHES